MHGAEQRPLMPPKQVARLRDAGADVDGFKTPPGSQIQFEFRCARPHLHRKYSNSANVLRVRKIDRTVVAGPLWKTYVSIHL